MKRTSLQGSFFVLATSVFAAACGGGGSDSADAPPSTPDSSRADAAGPDAPLPPTPDARPINRTCTPDQTTIPEGTVTITLSGAVVTTDGTGVVGATVDVLSPGSDVPIGSTVSGVDGAYSISSPVTPGSPALNAYVRIRHAEYVTNFIYPSDPVAGDLTFDPIMFEPGTLNLLYTVLGDTKRSDTASTLATLMVDCGFDPIDGAVFTSTPAAEKILYLDTSSALPAPEDDGNTAANGLALALNVPLGTVSVGGSYGALVLENHDVGSNTDGENPSITTTIVHPVPEAP